ncbi:MAG: hypothetical protein V7765_12070 [Oleispira sp.]
MNIRNGISSCIKILVLLILIAFITAVVFFYNLEAIKYYFNDNSIDTRTPELIEGGEYKIFETDSLEQWDHPNILSEPRLNFSLHTPIDSGNEKSIYRSKLEVGLYSLRLDGSDFRTILSPTDLERIFGRKVHGIDSMKRSSDNRYIAFIRGRNSSLYVIDLEKRTSKKIADIKGESFYWFESENKILFINNNKESKSFDDKFKLSLYDVDNGDKTDLSSRFWSTKHYDEFEYYPDLNKIIIVNKQMNIHNFNTGGLLERAPKEYYYGTPSSNSNFRIIESSSTNYNSRRDGFAFYRQGEPRNQIKLKYKVHSGRYVEFGPMNIYKSAKNIIIFNSMNNSASKVWELERAESLESLTISGITLDNYFKHNCQEDYLYSTVSGEKLSFCDSIYGWQHVGKKVSYLDELKKIATNYRIADEDRIEIIDDVIKSKTLKENIGEVDMPSKNILFQSKLPLISPEDTVKEIKELFSSGEYFEAAKKITVLNYNENLSNSVNKEIITADRLFDGLSYYDIKNDLFDVSKQCLTLSEDPIRFLSEQYYESNLWSWSSAGPSKKQQRMGITRKLKFLIPLLVQNDLKALARNLVEKSHEFGLDLVTYEGKEYDNAEEFLRIYYLIGDQLQLKELVRNIQEQADSHYASTKEYRVLNAKRLASFYVFQGNKDKAYKLLDKVSEGTGVLSILDSGDTDLNLAFGKTKSNIPPKDYPVKVKGKVESEQLDLASLKQVIEPENWVRGNGANNSGVSDYFEIILPSLTPAAQADAVIIKKLTDFSCGLLFTSHYTRYPHQLKNVKNVFE